MAWVAPSSVSNSQLITTAKWNQDVTTNTQFLYDNLGILDAKIGFSLLSSAGTFSFTSLSTSYDSLILIMHLKSDYTVTVNDYVKIRFNNDSATSYRYELLSAISTTVAGTSNTATSLFGAALNCTDSHATPGASTVSSYYMVIPHYANTTLFKHAICYGSYATGTNGTTLGVQIASGEWYNATPAAISRIDIAPTNGTNFAIGSMVAIFAAQSI